MLLLTYLLTYLLTPWCRVLVEKLIGLQLVKKFPAFHGTRRFIAALTSVRQLSLSWAALISQIYFCNKTLHVSDISSVHHQEFFTVHTAMVYVIQVCWQLASRIRTEFHADPAHSLSHGTVLTQRAARKDLPARCRSILCRCGNTIGCSVAFVGMMSC